MKKKFRVGIVGAGHIAKTFHLPAWKKNKKTKIVAICDIDNKRLKKISKKFKVKNTYNNLEKMLKKEKLDILNICTPPNMHFQHIFLGSKYKANILVEKPFVLNKIQSKKIIKIIKKNKVKCMCAMHQRFRPISSIIKDVIQKNKIGKIYYIKVAIKQYRNVPIHSKVFSDKTKSGGGPLIDLGSHYFDLACWFLNFPKIKSITANNFNNLVKMSKIVKRYLPFEKFSNEEFTTGIINFKNKSTINFEISYLLNVKQNLREIEIYGEKGSIFWPNGNIYFENRNNKLQKQKIKKISRDKASQLQVDHFVSVVSKQKTQMIKLSESNYVAELIDNLYKSANLGMGIKIEKS